MPRIVKHSIFSKPTATAMISLFVAITGCNGRGDREGTAEQALTAVEDAKLSCGDFQAEAGTCLDSLTACLDEAGRDDAEACFAELTQCAPIGPPPIGVGVGEGAGQPAPDGEGAPPPPPPPPPGDAGEPILTPPGGDGHGHGDGDGHGDGHGDGDCPKGGGGSRYAPPPDPCVAGGLPVEPCMEALKVCSETSADRAACLADAATCIGDIIEQTFQGFCEEQLAACSERDRSEEICAEIEQHCADGVPPALPANSDLP
jgi:hypothetical protein